MDYQSTDPGFLELFLLGPIDLESKIPGVFVLRIQQQRLAHFDTGLVEILPAEGQLALSGQRSNTFSPALLFESLLDGLEKVLGICVLGIEE